MNSMRLVAPFFIGFVFLALSQLSYGQIGAPSPAPQPPSNDGSAVDRGVAYVLLLVALAITYFVH